MMARWVRWASITAPLVLSLMVVGGAAPGTAKPLTSPDAQSPDAASTDRVNQAERLFAEGVQQFQQQQYEAALGSWQQAADLYRQVGNRRQEGRVLGNMGAIYEGLGRYEQAIAFFEQSLAVATSIDDSVGQSFALSNIGYVYTTLGHYDIAIEHHQRALELARARGDRADEWHILNNLGTVYKAQGNYAQALDSFAAGLTVARDMGDRTGEAQVLGNMGNAAAESGEYSAALGHYDQALSLFRGLGDRRGEAIVQQRLGNVYLDIGNLEAAQVHYESSLTQSRALRDLRLEAYNLGNLGIVARHRQDSMLAFDYLNAALDRLQTLGDRPHEAVLHNVLGNLYADQGDYPQAQAEYEQSLALAQAIQNRSSEAIALGNLGFMADLMGEDERAIDLYQQSLALAESMGDRLRQGQALNNLGALYYFDLDEPERAVTLLTSAVEIWESIRPGLSDENQISLFETQAHTYRLLQMILIELNRPDEALEMSERGRARAFVEQVARRLSVSATTPFQSDPLTARAMRRVARAQRATLVQYSILQDGQLAIWVIPPSGAIELRLSSLEDVQQSIPEIAESARVAAALGRSPRRNRLDRLVRDARQVAETAAAPASPAVDRSSPRAIAASGGEGPEAIARISNPDLQALYRLLIEPIHDLLPDQPDEPVVLIPHEALFLVPFAALQDEEGRFLIERHTLRSAPAIQVLALHQQRQARPFSRSSALSSLVIGNPTMPNLGNPPEPLAPLPNAEQEAEAIAALLNTSPILGGRATESRIVQQMPSAQIIHLATHGLLDDRAELGIPGAIALAPDTQEDGILTANEILNLSLTANLVVLSACNTGRGRITGDGVVGLSRTFMAVGAESVVVSLWAVQDDATATLMTSFYQNLQADMSYAQALRMAMLSTMEQYPSPRDWAAFTLMGAGEPN